MLIILTSTSRAQEWEYLGLPGRIITAIAVRSADTIYASVHSGFPPTPGSVFRTTNAGLTWDTVVTNGSMLDLKMNPRNPEILYAGLGGSIYQPYGILKTTDAGNSWFHADSGIYVDWETSVGVIEFDPMQPETLYAGTHGFFGGNLYKSTNGGQSWAAIGDGTLLEAGPTAIAIDPQSTQTIYVGTSSIGSLLKSTDGGMSWGTTGLEGVSVLELAIDPLNHLLLLAGVDPTGGGAQRSTDGGIAWTISNSGLPEGSALEDVEIHPLNRIVYGVAADSAGGIFVITDFGETWVAMTGPPIDVGFSDLELSPDDQALYGGARDYGIYRTFIMTHVSELLSLAGKSVILYPNYPNPFNPTTVIKYDLPTDSHVSLKVYDVLGREVLSLVDGVQTAGIHQVTLNASELSSGVYFYRLKARHMDASPPSVWRGGQAGSFTDTKRLLLLK